MTNPFTELNREIARLNDHLRELMNQNPPDASRVLATGKALKYALRKRVLIFVFVVVLLGLASYAAVILFSSPAASVLRYEGHEIPLDQLRVVDAHPGCEEPHYHAAVDGRVTDTEGVVIVDEDRDCGYGIIR